MALRRDWRAARAKVEQEGACRVCGARPGERRGHRIVTVEAAHVAGRVYDRRRSSSRVVVEPDDVVPLCGPFGDTAACHTRYDYGQLDLFPHLTDAEWVAVAGHLGNAGAMRRLQPRSVAI